MIDINVTGGELNQKELDAYIDHVKKQNPGKTIESLSIKLNGDFVDLEYNFKEIPFSRIRRITGYLVGDMTRWNDAKAAEERDRVKHM